MQRLNIFLGTCVLLCLGVTAQAQNECGDYHRFNCERATDARFSINGQSKSAPMQIGVPTELNIIVYRGQDYRISFCMDENIIGEHVVARLIEKIRVPKEVEQIVSERVEILDENGEPTGEYKEVQRTEKSNQFVDERKVLWDNQNHDMAQEVEFSCTSTKRVVVEVIAPGAAEVKPKYEGKDIGCVGILIEHMPTPMIGF